MIWRKKPKSEFPVVFESNRPWEEPKMRWRWMNNSTLWFMMPMRLRFSPGLWKSSPAKFGTHKDSCGNCKPNQSRYVYYYIYFTFWRIVLDFGLHAKEDWVAGIYDPGDVVLDRETGDEWLILTVERSANNYFGNVSCYEVIPYMKMLGTGWWIRRHLKNRLNQRFFCTKVDEEFDRVVM